jgi:hypothetical protein
MTPTPDHEALEKAYEAAAKEYAEEHSFDDEDLSWIIEYEVKPLITAFLSSLDGYKLIAREPTEGMIKDVQAFVKRASQGHVSQYITDADIFCAMFDAAPDITKKERSDGSTYLALSH